MSNLANAAIPIGVYIGNPNADDPAEEALFEKDYADFERTLGTPAHFITAFTDHRLPIDQWINSATWQASSNRQSPVARALTPVIALPMASLAAGSPTPDQFFKNFASGAYDKVLTSLVKAWADQGFKEQYWRPGWEMNLTSSPWYAGSDPATQADWIKAFQHIYSVLHAAAAANGVDVQVIWNPNTSNYSDAGVATKTLYPGSQFVDIIGVDVYSDISPYGAPNAIYDWAKNDGSTSSNLQEWASNPVNLTHYWTYPAATQWALDSSQGHSLSLQDLIDFARAQGKPFAIPETGAGTTRDGAGVADDPAFVEWLSSTLAKSGVTIPFVNIWNSNGGSNYKFSAPEDGKPLEAAAWGKYFGTTAASLAVSSAPTVGSTTTVGSGSHQLALTVTEDAWQGDAQFAVSVDGQQIGGVLTATALHGSGRSQTINVQGDFGPGSHKLGVTFLNDRYGGTAATDRNLYVDGVQLDGQPLDKAWLTLLSNGAQSIDFRLAGPPPVTQGSPAAPVTPGSGADSLHLLVSEDRWQGDAQFTVTIDGTTLPGVHTVTSSHAAGQSQDVVVGGSWGSGAHAIGVSFINDAWGGTAVADRNLYVDAISYNGRALGGAPAALLGNETRNFNTASTSAAATIKVLLAEDAWQGDAQYSLAIDNTTIGSAGTVTVSKSSGLSQAVTLQSVLSSGAHDLAVSFLNDRYGGSASTDRNLYVQGIEVNGQRVPNAAAALYSAQTNHFTFIVP